MPCLILTGHPCVGKTTLASIIQERALQHSSKRIQSVVIVNEEMACPGLTKAQCYLNSHNEKKTRGSLKACFDQAVVGGSSSSSSSKENKQQQQLVILDSLNYIKGFRYELHCISKSAGEQHGVIWVLNSMPLAKEWNRVRNEKESVNTSSKHAPFYTDMTMDELILRYEPPDERNRWDKPLYKVDMRPQEFKTQQPLQGNEQQTTTTTTAPSASNNSNAAEGEILGKSVYNMHALSDVMGNNSATTNNDTAPSGGIDTAAGTSTGNAESGKPPKKTFKGFKRAPKTAKPVEPTIIASTSALPNLPPTTSDTGNIEEPVLFPKDFLYSSKPSEQPVHTDAPSMDNNDEEISTNNIEEATTTTYSRDNHHPRRGPRKPPPALPPKPDPLTTIEEQVDAILDAFLLHVKPLTEGTSTRPHVAVSANALHQMDSITQSVCDAIVQGQTQGTMVGRIPIVLKKQQQLTTTNNKNRSSLFLNTHRSLPLAELKRLRRQYLRWVATHPPDDCESEYGIAQSFVSYIEAQL